MENIPFAGAEGVLPGPILSFSMADPVGAREKEPGVALFPEGRDR